jgi:hypothetical protein
MKTKIDINGKLKFVDELLEQTKIVKEEIAKFIEEFSKNNDTKVPFILDDYINKKFLDSKNCDKILEDAYQKINDEVQRLQEIKLDLWKKSQQIKSNKKIIQKEIESIESDLRILERIYERNNREGLPYTHILSDDLNWLCCFYECDKVDIDEFKLQLKNYILENTKCAIDDLQGYLKELKDYV